MEDITRSPFPGISSPPVALAPAPSPKRTVSANEAAHLPLKEAVEFLPRATPEISKILVGRLMEHVTNLTGAEQFVLLKCVGDNPEYQQRLLHLLFHNLAELTVEQLYELFPFSHGEDTNKILRTLFERRNEMQVGQLIPLLRFANDPNLMTKLIEALEEKQRLSTQQEKERQKWATQRKVALHMPIDQSCWDVDDATVLTRNDGVYCDGCLAPDFLGRRFRCTQCEDFDLCRNCVRNGITKRGHRVDHQMKEFRSPIQVFKPVKNEMFICDITKFDTTSSKKVMLSLLCPLLPDQEAAIYLSFSPHESKDASLIALMSSESASSTLDITQSLVNAMRQRNSQQIRIGLVFRARSARGLDAPQQQHVVQPVLQPDRIMADATAHVGPSSHSPIVVSFGELHEFVMRPDETFKDLTFKVATRWNLTSSDFMLIDEHYNRFNPDQLVLKTCQDLQTKVIRIISQTQLKQQQPAPAITFPGLQPQPPQPQQQPFNPFQPSQRQQQQQQPFAPFQAQQPQPQQQPFDPFRPQPFNPLQPQQPQQQQFPFRRN